MAASAKQELIELTDAYLATEHQQDSVKYPAEIKAIAAHIGRSRGAFYNWLRKGDPDIAALFDRIEAAASTARGSEGRPSLSITPPGTNACQEFGDEELATEIDQGLKRAVWSMKSYISTVERSEAVEDVPLLIAELDVQLARLRAIYSDLQAPAAEWARRRRSKGLLVDMPHPLPFQMTLLSELDEAAEPGGRDDGV